MQKPYNTKSASPVVARVKNDISKIPKGRVLVPCMCLKTIYQSDGRGGGV